jgi:hypothetical protein
LVAERRARLVVLRGEGLFLMNQMFVRRAKKNAKMALKKKPPSRRRLNKNEVFGKI